MMMMKKWITYLKKIPGSSAEDLKDFVVARVLAELEEGLAEKLQDTVRRYVCN